MSTPVDTQVSSDSVVGADATAQQAVGRRRTLRRVVATLLAVFLGVGVLASALLAANILVVAATQDTTRTDALVVLGAAQFNGRPSRVLENRAAHALSLYNRGVAPRVITVGANRPGDLFTEAGTAAKWLRSQGLPASAIVALPVGHDTLSSLRVVAQLAARQHWTSITIVTDPAHSARSAQIARDLGLTVHTAPTQTGPGSSVTPHYFAREFLSTLHYLLAERPFVHAIGASH